MSSPTLSVCMGGEGGIRKDLHQQTSKEFISKEFKIFHAINWLHDSTKFMELSKKEYRAMSMLYMILDIELCQNSKEDS